MYTIREIAAIVGGRLVRGNEAAPRRIVHDSREIQPGDFFVALRGDRVDGHVFLADAFSRGAYGALISDSSFAPKDARNVVIVGDVLDALHRLSAAWRDDSNATLVGITGSNGKTTTRSLLGHILRERDRADAVFSAPKNYNTEVGLPLALLAMPRTASVGLFELGAERPGDIGLLCDLLAPRIGLITSIGASHLAGLGSLEAVATEKWSLVEKLPRDGYAVVNADSPHLRRRAREATARCVTVGLKHGEVRGRIEQAVPELRVTVDEPRLQLSCPLIGAHNAVDLLLAAATAERLGVPPDAIEERVRTFVPVPHRLQTIHVSFGTILDDTYNANPPSTTGALETLARLGGDRTRRVFVFGEMRDLGPDTARYHREVLDVALRLEIDAIFPVGEQAIAACRERSSAAVTIVARNELAGAVRSQCRGGRDAIILVKGSRALALDELVDEFVRDRG